MDISSANQEHIFCGHKVFILSHDNVLCARLQVRFLRLACRLVGPAVVVAAAVRAATLLRKKSSSRVTLYDQIVRLSRNSIVLVQLIGAC